MQTLGNRIGGLLANVGFIALIHFEIGHGNGRRDGAGRRRVTHPGDERVNIRAERIIFMANGIDDRHDDRSLTGFGQHADRLTAHLIAANNHQEHRRQGKGARCYRCNLASVIGRSRCVNQQVGSTNRLHFRCLAVDELFESGIKIGRR